MGTKFANLHVKTINQEVILDALQRLSDKAGSILSTPDNIALSTIDQYVYRGSKENQNKIKATSVTYYIHQEMNWTSVLNDQLSWGTVERIGELLSNFVTEPVMTIGFFDEDIFEFTLFQDGEVKSKKYFCEEWAIEEYGLESEVVDLDYIEKVLELNYQEISNLLEIRNPEQAIDELSRMIQINLWVHSDWISDVKEIEKIYSKLELKIM